MNEGISIPRMCRHRYPCPATELLGALWMYIFAKDEFE